MNLRTKIKKKNQKSNIKLKKKRKWMIKMIV